MTTTNVYPASLEVASHRNSSWPVILGHAHAHVKSFGTLTSVIQLRICSPAKLPAQARTLVSLRSQKFAHEHNEASQD